MPTLQFTEGSMIFMAAAMVVGWFLKNKTEFSNKAIPVVTLAIQFLQQVLLQAGVAQAAMEGAPLPIAAISFSGLGQLILQAVAQWLILTGAHSVGKNTTQGLKAPHS